MDINLLDRIYESLRSANEKLSERFLSEHKKGLGDVEDFKLDTRSYCVLLHAALESFVEDVSLFVAKYSFHAFKETGEITIPLMFLMNGTSSYGDRFIVKDSSDDDEGSYIRKHVIDFILDCEHKVNMKWKDVIGSNHGIKPKHLNAVLQAVGIHCHVDDENFSSWKSFSSFRGAFAHTGEAYLSGDTGEYAIKELSPEYADKYGIECIQYAGTIIDEAKKILSGREYVRGHIVELIQQRKAKAEQQAESEYQRRISKQEEDVATKELKAKAQEERDAKAIKNIELTKKLEKILDYIEKNPDSYRDLHSVLFDTP